MYNLKRSKKSKTRAEREKTNKLSKEYLDQTDWYVTRFLETGKPVPRKITRKRAKARKAVRED